MRRLAGAIAGLALAAWSGAAAAQDAAADEPITTLSVAEVRALVVESGGVVVGVEHDADGEYKMEITYPDDLPVYFEGLTCTGEGDAKRCREFRLSVNFDLASEAAARTAEHDLAIVWLSDAAIGKRLKVWRMDFLAGMTLGHMRGTFETFLSTVGVARDAVFPRAEAGAEGTEAARP